MNLDDIIARIDAMQAELSAVRAEVQKARELRDPLAAHIYTSRRDSPRVQASAGKSGKNIESFLRTSYQQAVRLGYTSNFQTWLDLLSAHPKPDR
jgi:hypothetical protein